MQQPLIICHRTCPVEAPENSLEGIGVAAKYAADGVEIDLRVSLDQSPFLMHDWTMRRMTGWPLALELTPSPIARRLRLRNSEETVPRLAEALDVLAPELLLAVDVKTPWAVAPLVREVKRRGIEKRVLAWCQSAQAARYVIRSAPGIEVAYLKDTRRPADHQRFIEKARSIGADAISAHWRVIDIDFVATAHSAGLKVYSYHGGAELTPEKLTSGLDGLITDFPDKAREAYRALV